MDDPATFHISATLDNTIIIIVITTTIFIMAWFFTEDQRYQHTCQLHCLREADFRTVACCTSGEITVGDDWIDEQRRWCGERGSLKGCNFCHNAFCKRCVKSNLGQSEVAGLLLCSVWHLNDILRWSFIKSSSLLNIDLLVSVSKCHTVPMLLCQRPQHL